MAPQQERYQDPLTPPEDENLGSCPSNNESDAHHHHVLMEEIDPHESVKRPSIYRRQSFVMQFVQTKGPPQIVLLCLLLALGFGSTIGVVPAVMTDRYARLNHDYVDSRDCADYGMVDKPNECLQGSADAQNAAALASLVSNVLTFITSSLVGSISDERGRRGILIFCLFLSLLSPVSLVLLQVNQDLSPDIYYIAHASTGLVSWIAVSLSSLSDVLPPDWRAAGFGLLLAGFSLGFALSPILALVMDHFQVSCASLVLVGVGFLTALFFFPETLPPETAAASMLLRSQQDTSTTGWGRILWILNRPFRELSILNRNSLFRLLSSLAFFSGMVSSADQTLLVYYLEERLAFNDGDVAIVFVLIGVMGIVAQAVLIKPFIDCFGERYVVVIAFVIGAIDNVMYGLARNKSTIFVAVAISTLGGMSFPTISAIKSNNVEESEQGRIQGALYSVQALASGVGPVFLRWIYSFTKDNPYPGAGTMFIVAACLYLVAVACACALPKDKTDSAKHRRDSASVSKGDYEAIDNDPFPLS